MPRNPDRQPPPDCETVPVLEAGRILGYGRDATRAAVRDGRLPTIDLNGNGYGERVAKSTLRKLLGES
jgi:hypothetical protein